MRLESLLPFMAAVALVGVSSAQEPLPRLLPSAPRDFGSFADETLNDVSDLTAKAQSGVPEAQYLLALIYSDARLMPRDMAVSRQWMLKAAEQEYVPAEFGMGEMYLVNAKPDPSPTTPMPTGGSGWQRRHGDAEAQFWLGAGYERGSFGAIDYREALKWLRMASAQGLPDAQYCLGGMYEDGEGVAESDEKAALWYRKAADHFLEVSGVWHAAVQMNNMYRDGRLRKDDVEAYMWAAIVGTTGNPPDETDMKRIARNI